jgi:hypothetical protein
MHVLISAETKPPLDHAKQLTESLLSHVRQEYYQYSQAKVASQYYGYYPQVSNPIIKNIVRKYINKYEWFFLVDL